MKGERLPNPFSQERGRYWAGSRRAFRISDPMLESKKYTLAPGAQVREEEFGLLFYTMQGPRLFFLFCGDLLRSHFFDGHFTVEEWFESRHERVPLSKSKLPQIEKRLHELKGKAVILEP
jgi:putative mycofactocin binding protein MftB